MIEPLAMNLTGVFQLLSLKDDGFSFGWPVFCNQFVPEAARDSPSMLESACGLSHGDRWGEVDTWIEGICWGYIFVSMNSSSCKGEKHRLLRPGCHYGWGIEEVEAKEIGGLILSAGRSGTTSKGASLAAL